MLGLCSNPSKKQIDSKSDFGAPWISYVISLANEE